MTGIEKGIQLVGFKAVVYAEHILVTFCFTTDCWKCSSLNLPTRNQLVHWAIICFVLHLPELNLDKGIRGNFKIDSTSEKDPYKLEGHISIRKYFKLEFCPISDKHSTICACQLKRAGRTKRSYRTGLGNS